MIGAATSPWSTNFMFNGFIVACSRCLYLMFNRRSAQKQHSLRGYSQLWQFPLLISALSILPRPAPVSKERYISLSHTAFAGRNHAILRCNFTTELSGNTQCRIRATWINYKHLCCRRDTLQAMTNIFFFVFGNDGCGKMNLFQNILLVIQQHL